MIDNTNKLLKICIIIVLIGIGISTSYYFIIAKPATDKQMLKIKQETLAKEKNKEKLFKECVADADKYFQESWDKWCKDYGQDHMSSGCGLPESQTQKLTTLRKQDLETCFKLYGEQE